MWQIPTQTRYGCGYVYSDEFRTPDEAHAEVERVLGRKIEVRGDIQFQIGRLETGLDRQRARGRAVRRASSSRWNRPRSTAPSSR